MINSRSSLFVARGMKHAKEKVRESGNCPCFLQHVNLTNHRPRYYENCKPAGKRRKKLATYRRWTREFHSKTRRQVEHEGGENNSISHFDSALTIEA